MELNEFDLEILNSKGISQEKLAEELQMLADGFPYLRIEAPATPGHGISVLSPEMENQAESLWNQYLAAGGRVLKMVPASGAASRMFKDLFSFANGKKDKPDNDFMKKFFDEIENFAFFPQLNFLCLSLHGLRKVSTTDNCPKPFCHSTKCPARHALLLRSILQRVRSMLPAKMAKCVFISL